MILLERFGRTIYHGIAPKQTPQRSLMLPTPVRNCRSKGLAGGVRRQLELPKCHVDWDAGHGFPDSGLPQIEPPIIDGMGKKWPCWPGHYCGLLTVLACLVLTGCAGVSAGGGNSNNNQAGAGQVSVAPAIVKFGTVALGSSVNLTGTLTAGSSDINVSSADWNGQGYSVSGITFPIKVAAGTSVNYTVTFAPQVAGDVPGNISFVNDGAVSPVGQALDGVGGQAGLHTVGLSWDASTSTVVGYNVYRGTQSGGPYQLLTVSPQPGTSYSDGTVLTNTTYYYVATAVDSKHLESPFSNQAKAVVP